MVGDLYLGRTERWTYQLGTRLETWDTKFGWTGGIENYIISFCKETFERLTGIMLEPGEIRKVEEIRFVFAEED